MILELEDQAPIDPATDRDIVDKLRELTFPAAQFAILRNPPLFIQAAVNEDGSYVVQYSDGARDKMFEFEPATLTQVTQAFLLFLKGGDYRKAVPYYPLQWK